MYVSRYKVFFFLLVPGLQDESPVLACVRSTPGQEPLVGPLCRRKL